MLCSTECLTEKTLETCVTPVKVTTDRPSPDDGPIPVTQRRTKERHDRRAPAEPPHLHRRRRGHGRAATRPRRPLGPRDRRGGRAQLSHPGLPRPALRRHRGLRPGTAGAHRLHRLPPPTRPHAAPRLRPRRPRPGHGAARQAVGLGGARAQHPGARRHRGPVHGERGDRRRHRPAALPGPPLARRGRWALRRDGLLRGHQRPGHRHRQRRVLPDAGAERRTVDDHRRGARASTAPSTSTGGSPRRAGPR